MQDHRVYRGLRVRGQVSQLDWDARAHVLKVRLLGFDRTIFAPEVLVVRVRIGEIIRAICCVGIDQQLYVVDVFSEEKGLLLSIQDEDFLRLHLQLVPLQVPEPRIISAEAIESIRELEQGLIRYLQEHPDSMRQLNSDTFERLVAEMLASYRFKVEWTGRNRETAGDVIAVKYDDAAGLEGNFIVECKRYSEGRPVGIEVARALYGAKADEHFANALLVTTSFFQDGVIQFASRRWDLQLKDYEGLVRWLQHYRARADGDLHMNHRRLDFVPKNRGSQS